MKTIFIRFYDPKEVMDVTPEITDKEIKEYCFRVNKYETCQQALTAYADTGGVTWSTLLDESEDVDAWIEEAYKRIKNNDTDWLETNFV